jgi:hypothetical protein
LAEKFRTFLAIGRFLQLHDRRNRQTPRKPLLGQARDNVCQNWTHARCAYTIMYGDIGTVRENKIQISNTAFAGNECVE